MKRNKIIRTLALTLCILSTPVVEGLLIDYNIASKSLLINEAHAATLLTGTDDSPNIQNQLLTKTVGKYGEIFGSFLYTNMRDSYGNYTGVAYARPISSNVNGAVYDYYLFTIDKKGKLISTYQIEDSINKGTSVKFYNSGIDYYIEIVSSSGTKRHKFRGGGGVPVKVSSVSGTNITRSVGTDGEVVTDDFTVNNKPSALGMTIVKFGDIYLAFNRFYYSTGQAPWLSKGLGYYAFTMDNPTFKRKLDKFTVTFNYRGKDGVAKESSSSYDESKDTKTYSIAVLKDEFNYQEFKCWDSELGVVTSNTSYNAIYENSEDSFWKDDIRYGVIDGTNTVTVLGTTLESVIIPGSIEYGGAEYKVEKLQGNFSKREGNVSDITVSSEILYNSSNCLNGVTDIKITGGTSGFKSSILGIDSLVTADLSEYTGNITESMFENVDTLKNIKLNNTLDEIEIGFKAFYCASSLNNIEYRGTFKLTGGREFYSCTNLPNMANISIEQVGSKSFSRCNNLTSLDLSLCKTVPDDVVELSTSMKYIKMTESVLGTGQFTGLANKITFYDEDEATYLGGYACKSGTNLSAIQEKPIKYGFTFKKWGRLSGGSTITNIQDSTTFVAEYSTGGDVHDKVQAPTLNISKQNESNRNTVQATLS